MRLFKGGKRSVRPDTAAVYSKSETTKTDETSGKKKVSGQTIGNPQLSEKQANIMNN